MHTAPHPSQVRLSCERCRRQKLRCSRKTDGDISCSRCTRLGFPCESGEQRKVGRPMRQHSAVVKRPSASVSGTGTGTGTDTAATDATTTTTAATAAGPHSPCVVDAAAAAAVSTHLEISAALGEGVSPMDFLDTPNDLSISEFSFPLDSPFSFASPHDTSSTSSMTPPDPILPTLTLVGLSPDSQGAHFNTLSKINTDLHAALEVYRRFVAGYLEEPFEFLGNARCDTIGLLQALWGCCQEYLRVLKAMHRKAGMKVYLDTDVFPPSHAAVRTQALHPTIPANSHVVDAPTALLLISCYLQIITLFEMIMVMSVEKLCTRTKDLMPAGVIQFAGVTLWDEATLVILSLEMSKHSITRMSVLLGLPNKPYPPRLGLLTPPQYREVLNKELGSVEGDWSSRPQKLVDLFEQVRGGLQDTIAIGDY